MLALRARSREMPAGAAKDDRVIPAALAFQGWNTRLQSR
jgi:hypothetical protein